MNGSRSEGRGKKGLRIAMVVSPWYQVPPKGYGGIELMAFLLSSELQLRGHEVTVIGQEGSRGSFETVGLTPESWTECLGSPTQEARSHLFLRRAYEYIRHREFDIVHDHMGLGGMLLAAALPLDLAAVATFHGAPTQEESEFLSSVSGRIELVAISHSQQAQAPGVDWRRVVYNAVDPLDYRPIVNWREKDAYLVQLARICPDKGQHLAIAVAKRLGLPLVLAGKIDPNHSHYFKREIAPHLGNGVSWLENVFGDAKRQLLARARAMLFPIQWEEPFGIAMIEAMVSGTPVLALKRGAANEVVEPAITGFLADDVEGLVDAASRITDIDLDACVDRARTRFGMEQMADGYEAVYETAVEQSPADNDIETLYGGRLAAAG